MSETDARRTQCRFYRKKDRYSRGVTTRIRIDDSDGINFRQLSRRISEYFGNFLKYTFAECPIIDLRTTRGKFLVAVSIELADGRLESFDLNFFPSKFRVLSFPGGARWQERRKTSVWREPPTDRAESRIPRRLPPQFKPSNGRDVERINSNRVIHDAYA